MKLLPVASILAILTICFAASDAVAAIQDGGFEGSVCDATQCTNPQWTTGVTSAFASSTGPICRAGTGSGNTACETGGSAAFGGSTWVRLGAGYKETTTNGGIISWVVQSVVVPPAPATLTFRLRIINQAAPTGSFKVELAETEGVPGTDVFTVADTTPGFSSYAPVAVDLSRFAGSTRLLRFEGFSAVDPIGPLDSYDIDAVSLDTAPETVIGSKKIKGTTAKFTFSSSVPGPTFQCKLEKRKFNPCTSPKKYKHLSPGKHKFKVRAIDTVGHIDATPAKTKFKISA